MKYNYINSVQDLLKSLYIPDSWIDISRSIFLLIILLLICIIGFYIAKYIAIKVIKRIINKTRNSWDDKLFSNKFFKRISYLIPAILTFKLIAYVLPFNPGWVEIILTATNIYIVMIVLLSLYTLLDTFSEIYNEWEVSKYKPIKGYVQLIKVILACVAAILIIAAILGQSPLIFLTGLGALSAVLMLVFKDALLGLVAGVQISANDMARPGDWITMEKYKADGDVLEITLTTVKVRNFDNSIVYIPAYVMISDSFINWRGMYESEGRRIKRAIYIDMDTVKFCSPELLEKYSKIELVKNYISEKQIEIETYNHQHQIDESSPVNGRKQTNLGIFRIYMQAYLRTLDTINQESTLMVRQLPSMDKGIALEVYAFCISKEWIDFEDVQSNIFDHFYAALKYFDLALYQTPSSNNLKSLIENSKL